MLRKSAISITKTGFITLLGAVLLYILPLLTGCGKIFSLKRIVKVGASVALAADHGTLFYAFDTLARPGEKISLRARVISIDEMEDIEDATVEFVLKDKSLGVVRTDDEGYATLKWRAPEVEGDYLIKVRIIDVPSNKFKEALKVAPASLLVAVRAEQTPFIVIDLDHTVVDSSFFSVLLGKAKPMKGAAKTIKELNRHYSLIYLTHRPELLANKSKNWLNKNGFVRAPLLVSSLRQAIGSSAKFKATRLKNLRQKFPNICIGIGDKFEDVQAYLDNDMVAYLIPHYDKNDDDDLRKMIRKISKLDKSVQVVETWKEIRAGILQGEKFTPAEFVRKLRIRLEHLKRTKEKEKKKHKDDDADDD